MDTKWNSMDRAPEEPLEQAAEPIQDEVKEGDSVPKRGRHVKAVIAFLAFVLGVSLVLGSLGAMAGRLIAQRGSPEWQVSDWQETEAFRAEVADYLQDFLSLGAGEHLNWYGTNVVQEGGYGSARWYGVTYSDAIEADSDFSSSSPVPSDKDLYYRNDKSVLYRVTNAKKDIYYSNVDDSQALSIYNKLPEGYNFMLAFLHGKVTIVKDGQTLDVYGDGIYDADSDWFVPGYENFPAGEGVEDVSVYMAVRETPLQYFTQNGVQTARMYWVYERLQEARAFYFRQAVLLGAGVLFLLLWLALRREKRLADQKLASWTLHVWTEPRFLAVAACLLWMTAGNPAMSELVWAFRYEIFESWDYWAGLVGRYLLLLPVSNIPALLGLVWVLWLIHNDHRYNPKEKRRSLWRLISIRLPRYTFQKRMNWLNRAAAVLVCVFPAAGVLLTISLGLSPQHWLFWLMAAVPVIAAAALLLILRKHTALARDIGLLSGQVEAIRSGDLSTPLDLPENADLRQTAEALNDIQAGLHTALAEQTRSERMKVELVSNVSHDLKTPLTSILSYAELLRQEPLEGAAADYARIIDEKAQRLRSMVQDVFDISKAAADQLPVRLERLDLAKLLRQTLADMDDPIQASHLTFKIGLPDTPVEIVADGRRLYRVFQNLIQNALQYALEGSRVHLTLTTGAGKAAASLRNVSREELPQGVDFTARFVRGDESRTDGGSGLGLSIASSFTQACGGEFRVETVADLFTAVVTFPLAD